MITKIVTSFSIHRQQRQQACLDSWRKLDLPIVAVQTAGQIDQLSQMFAGVEFVSVPERDNAWGRPYLAHIFDHCKQATDETILLINSDILVADQPADFAKQWMTDDADTLVCGVRYEHPRGKSWRRQLNPLGIDAFRITPAMASVLPDAGFPIGLPGWDYWLTWELHQQEYKIRRADSQLLHETHDMGYQKDAVATAYELLWNRYRIPRQLLSQCIQHITDRKGMRRP